MFFLFTDLLERQLATSQNTSSTLSFKFNVTAADHCTEIFCRARSDEDLNVLSARLTVQVEINGVVGKCGPEIGTIRTTRDLRFKVNCMPLAIATVQSVTSRALDSTY